MDYAALAAEITGGPQAAACAPHVHTNAMTKISGAEAAAKDLAIADILNAQAGADGTRKVPVRDVYLYLVKRLRWRGICNAADDADHPATDAAWTARAIATGPECEIDLLDPVSATLLGAMVATSLITAEQRVELEAMSRVARSRTEALFGRQVTADDVSIAIRGGAAFAGV